MFRKMDHSVWYGAATAAVAVVVFETILNKRISTQKYVRKTPNGFNCTSELKSQTK